MDGLLMIAMNKHREICSIQSSGGIMLLKEQVSGDLLETRQNQLLMCFIQLSEAPSSDLQLYFKQQRSRPGQRSCISSLCR